MQQKRLSSGEKRQAVFDALFDSPGPMTAYEVHKATGLGMDSLNYYLRKMLEEGFLVRLEDGSYTLQALFYTEEALRSFETALELVVSIASSHFVWDFVDNGTQDEFSVVATNLAAYLRSLERERNKPG